ncbi:DUF2239 family protein [Vulgatibacter incomptus]|uniref:DUF2239 family protein n=1 Tax=Vulgatibacter incomptus TaxID=1391653 RepID=UPI001F0A8540|nr:DUF2239 family protein [Vulgatibacter incomptus]
MKYAFFSGEKLIAHGGLEEVATAAKRWRDERESEPLAVYSDETGRAVDLDLRGSLQDVLARLAPARDDMGADTEPPKRQGPGRPKLGVVSKEVTLLPRHWDWLAQQPGGASVTLRKLVEAARRGGGGVEAARRSQEAAYRFMSAMAGDYPGFEEASRALFAHDFGRFDQLVGPWPADVRDHVRRLVAIAARDRLAAAL